MVNEPMRQVARIDKAELAEMACAWSNQERGRYLRLLLQLKGIDTHRIYRLEYYPHRRCWLLIQEVGPGRHEGPAAPISLSQADESFYLHAIAGFRVTARAANAALAARSPYFARSGRLYELPSRPQDMTPATLAKLLGGLADTGSAVDFDSEGGWRNRPSEN